MKNKSKDKLRGKIKDCAIYSGEEGTNSWLLSDEQVDKILSVISRELLQRLPKKWRNTRKTMLLSYKDGNFGFHTGTGFDHNKFTIRTLEEYGNSHYNQALSEVKSVIKELAERD